MGAKRTRGVSRVWSSSDLWRGTDFDPNLLLPSVQPTREHRSQGRGEGGEVVKITTVFDRGQMSDRVCKLDGERKRASKVESEWASRVGASLVARTVQSLSLADFGYGPQAGKYENCRRN